MRRLLVCLLLMPPVATFPAAAQTPALKLVLTSAPSAAECGAPEAWLKTAVAGAVLFDEREIAAYRETEHSLVLTAPAVTRLFSNAAAFAASPEDVTPAGTLFAAAGGGFLLMLGDTRIAGGAIVTLMQLAEAPPCAHLYPTIESMIQGPLALSIGRPRSHDELGEDPFKVAIEEGLDRVYVSAVPARAVEHLRRAGKVIRR